MVWLLGWPKPSALVFSALIAATDPVAVIAMFKDNGVRGRLRLLLESESLFNDGAAAVLFVMALAWSQSTETAQTSLGMIGSLVLIVTGGIAIGAACGSVALIVAWGSSEHLIEAAGTMIAAYGSFLIAEDVRVSGVIATVVIGLVIGNFRLLRGKSVVSPRGQEFILGFWDFAAFLANSVIFLLIGVTVTTMPFQSYGMAVLLAWRSICSVFSLCVPTGRFRLANSMSFGGADCAALWRLLWVSSSHPHCHCAMKSWS
jgi:monovalent cation:H+ antiporter, CPA1 family